MFGLPATYLPMVLGRCTSLLLLLLLSWMRGPFLEGDLMESC